VKLGRTGRRGIHRHVRSTARVAEQRAPPGLVANAFETRWETRMSLDYTTVKLVHQSAVVLSVAGFFARGRVRISVCEAVG